jgi:hypothetical protein
VRISREKCQENPTAKSHTAKWDRGACQHCTHILFPVPVKLPSGMHTIRPFRQAFSQQQYNDRDPAESVVVSGIGRGIVGSLPSTSFLALPWGPEGWWWCLRGAACWAPIAWAKGDLDLLRRIGRCSKRKYLLNSSAMFSRTWSPHIWTRLPSRFYCLSWQPQTSNYIISIDYHLCRRTLTHIIFSCLESEISHIWIAEIPYVSIVNQSFWSIDNTRWRRVPSVVFSI